ncbi:hypothetical protein DFR27_1739 [Umboniibacter marinipuniceus]|uniref:Lipoprotein n=1 Tax=Umboniibacter marinipuniceus TaxID=569599 RepID=A0A3M0A6Y8_9GAMM|nr:hypothetical protein DFR27_1739 [Umboniibacter marinipuniceus]
MSFINRISVLVAIVILSACSSVSSFDWSPLAIWSDTETIAAQPEEVRLYYISSEPINGELELSARQQSTGVTQRLTMEVVETQTIVNHSWSGDSLCYAYKMQLSQDGASSFRELQGDGLVVHAPRASDGIGWLRGQESELVRVDASSDISLEEWLAQGEQ